MSIAPNPARPAKARNPIDLASVGAAIWDGAMFGVGSAAGAYLAHRVARIPRANNPPGGVDEVAARELKLFIENDADLYWRRHTPIAKGYRYKLIPRRRDRDPLYAKTMLDASALMRGMPEEGFQVVSLYPPRGSNPRRGWRRARNPLRKRETAAALGLVHDKVTQAHRMHLDALGYTKRGADDAARQVAGTAWYLLNVASGMLQLLTQYGDKDRRSKEEVRDQWNYLNHVSDMLAGLGQVGGRRRTRRNPAARRRTKPEKLGGPPDPLHIRRFVDRRGAAPAGSSGWVHALVPPGSKFPGAGGAFPAHTKVWVVSDASTIGKFWPAVYDAERDVWVKTAPGHRWEEGRPVETYPNPRMTKAARKFISDKISKLVGEGKPQDQAVAIAYSMARRKGYKVPPAPNPRRARNRSLGRRAKKSLPKRAQGKRKARKVRRPKAAANPGGASNRMPIAEFKEWIRRHGTPTQRREFEKALKTYKQFHLGAEPKHVTQHTVAMGGRQDVAFAVSAGTAPTTTYTPPGYSGKAGSSYEHVWKRQPELLISSDGRALLTPLVSGNKVDDWLRG